MRSAMRPRYYCDHCNKGGGNPAAILKHERSCTANPNRVCGCCRMMGNKQEPIADLIAALGNGDQEGLDRLTKLADGCPACILAAIRQSGLQCGPDEEGNGFSVDFDFKAAMREWNKEYYYHYPEKGINMGKSPILEGDLVDYHSVIGGPITSHGHIVEEIGSLNGRTKVAWMTGRSDCVAIAALTHSVPLTEHSEHVIGNPVLVTATAKHSCDDCYGQGEGVHYCDLHGVPVKNMNVSICRDWQPKKVEG